VSLAFAILTGVSVLLTVWQWVCGIRFPLHARSGARGSFPGLTLFKPMRGWDEETGRCVESWLSQEYAGPVQVLFGVDEDDVEAQSEVRRLITRDSGDRVRLVLCKREWGCHPKVAKLVQLYPHARHDVFVVSDADTWAPADLLREAVPLLEDAGVGLVNCLYRQGTMSTLAMRWMGVAINADFWTQVLQSNSIKPQGFALGAVMMTRRREVEAIGGFDSLIDYLADDYQLGRRIVQQGTRIELTPVVVECRSAAMTWRQVWRHQLRQARNIRVCEPVPWCLSVLNNVTLWSLAWLLSSPTRWTVVLVGWALIIRVATALHSEFRLRGSRSGWRYFWYIPIKDLLHTVVWAASFLGNRIDWRGESFVLRRGGKLERRAR
jgi:ceramide glucosyltransferase